MMVFRRKQIVVLSLILMIVIAGYLQYSYKKSGYSGDMANKGKNGEAVYVDGESNLTAQNANGESVTASKEANEYFTQSKLEKQISRSKNMEKLEQITKDEQASEDIKAKAYEQLMNILALNEIEMRIQNLIIGKGYEDALVLFGEDDSIDVVVKAPELTDADVAQISDIVARQANVDYTSIHVRKVY